MILMTLESDRMTHIYNPVIRKQRWEDYCHFKTKVDYSVRQYPHSYKKINK